jgi:23S rRNA pseudouridine1911/1915/1917 synthase
MRSSIEPTPVVSKNTPASPLEIIDEQADYIIVDKPTFLLTHPTKPGPTHHFVEGIARAPRVRDRKRSRSLIGSSGLVLIAKTSAAARRFGLLMQDRQLHKEYLAIVWGWPEWTTKTVDAPILRQRKHLPSAIWLKQMIHPKGAEAITEFFVERRFERSTSAGNH